MSVLIDQAERDRFIFEQGKNISVIAPAGVGKTRSMVERIVHIAGQPDAESVLPRLIVVTYSVRAAQQMQQRARTAIRNSKVAPQAQRAFQQVFFGTIHSYCVRLLERFGHYLGLPSSVELLQDDAELWNRFLLHGLRPGMVDDAAFRELFHFFPPQKLYDLGREISPGPSPEIAEFPEIDCRPLFDFNGEGLHPATKKSIARVQGELRAWSEARAREDGFRPLPSPPDSEKAAAFIQLWQATFTPLNAWLRETALAFGRRVANDYEAFRRAEAVMTYDDQIRMALSVLEFPEVQRELAADRPSVLLDEAQDTDPRQFEVLLRVAGLPGIANQIDDQSFCMVGDFQQAIYAPRSDLAVYRQTHDMISAEPRGAVSKLQVTFRCDQAVIDFVNRLFPVVLNGTNGQCRFVELSARDDAGPGQVVRWDCPELPEPESGEKINAEMRARHEARFLAERIHQLGPRGLGAENWSQVAILCPRKNWLIDIQRELDSLGVPVQLHSSNEQQGDRPAAAWLTSLIWIAAHPEDSFEVVGVLREIFGVSDDAIARYTNGAGDRLRLDREIEDAGPVGDVLRLLREIFNDAGRMSLHQLARNIVKKTLLRERLESVPDFKLKNADRELDELLAVVAERSAGGATLAELAGELRLGLAQASAGEEEIRDAVQLMTSHKAKGLEWQTVVVPFVYRAIESKSPTYPLLAQVEGGREIICRDKDDFASRARDFVQLRDRQQLQRLLYVMATRARHTLLFIDDEELFSGQRRRGGWSAAELLDLAGEDQRNVWKSLPDSLVPHETAAQEETESQVPHLKLPDIAAADVAEAIQRAAAIPRRVTPHALAVHPMPEAEPESTSEREEGTPDNPGILYGTWWHEFVQSVPWKESRPTWGEKFDDAVKRSPDATRSRREWALFLKSPLADLLADPENTVQIEWPFLWRDDTGSCLEGVIDLAVHVPEKGAWEIVDWKTNRVGEGGSAAVVDIYREQIRAYVRALREMLSVEARGSLYLTQTGEWIEIDGL